MSFTTYLLGFATASILAAVIYVNDRRIRRRNARRRISNLMIPPGHQFKNPNPRPRPMQKPVVVDCPPKNRDIHNRSLFDKHEGDIHFFHQN